MRLHHPRTVALSLKMSEGWSREGSGTCPVLRVAFRCAARRHCGTTGTRPPWHHAYWSSETDPEATRPAATRPDGRHHGGTSQGDAQSKEPRWTSLTSSRRQRSKAHVAIPDEGAPPWDAFPAVWGTSWMVEAIQEGLVATTRQASWEAAWYDGGLTMRPQSAPTRAESAGEEALGGPKAWRGGCEVRVGAWWQALNDPRAL